MYAILGLLGTFLMIIVFPIMLLVLLFKVIRKTSTKKDKIRPFICFVIAIVLVVVAVKTTPNDTEKSEIQKTVEAIPEDEEDDDVVFEEVKELEEKPQETETKNINKSKDEIISEEETEDFGIENSEKLILILKNDIGFDEIVFVEKIEDTFNYKIKVDGYELVVTDLGDDFRIFMPNSKHTFYENSEVVMTKEKFEDKIVTSNEANVYYIMAQEVITSCLKNPKSADFPSLIVNPQDIGFKKNGDLVLVQSYVSAENSFGATVSSRWEVQFEVLDMETYSYDLKYINFDGEKSGSYIEMD